MFICPQAQLQILMVPTSNTDTDLEICTEVGSFILQFGANPPNTLELVKATITVPLTSII